MEDDREKVLASIRRRLRGTDKYDAVRDSRSPLMNEFAEGFDALFETFRSELARLGGEAVKVESEIEAARFIEARTDQNSSIFIYEDVANERTSLAAAIKKSRAAKPGSEFPRGYDKSQVAGFDCAVSGCFACIAETGTVVTSTGMRLPAALAGKLFVIADRRHLLPTLDELFTDRFTNFVGSNMFLITGPSRTADIEKQLVKGVHGPKEVFVILLKQQEG